MIPRQLRFKRRDEEQELITIHHILMKEYGWIPLEEFKEIPIPTLWNLLDCIKTQHEEEEKQMKKSRRKR